MMVDTEAKIWEKLREVTDPGANLNVVEMGLIRELTVSDDGEVNIILRPSSPVCPLAFVIAADVKNALEDIDEVSKVHLKIVDFVRADELNKMMAEA